MCVTFLLILHAKIARLLHTPPVGSHLPLATWHRQQLKVYYVYYEC